MTHTFDLGAFFAKRAQWNSFIEGRGYHGFSMSLHYDADLDNGRVDLTFYNTEWSSTSVPNDVKRFTSRNFDDTVAAIEKWVHSTKPEHEAREEQLLRDFARIKERIDASTLSDIIKAEVAAAMEKMSKNILEDKS